MKKSLILLVVCLLLLLVTTTAGAVDRIGNIRVTGTICPGASLIYNDAGVPVLRFDVSIETDQDPVIMGIVARGELALETYYNLQEGLQVTVDGKLLSPINGKLRISAYTITLLYGFL